MVGCVYFIKILPMEPMIKIGSSANFYNRMSMHKKNNPCCEILGAFEHNDYKIIERAIHKQLNEYSISYDKKRAREIYYITKSNIREFGRKIRRGILDSVKLDFNDPNTVILSEEIDSILSDYSKGLRGTRTH